MHGNVTKINTSYKLSTESIAEGLPIFNVFQIISKESPRRLKDELANPAQNPM